MERVDDSLSSESKEEDEAKRLCLMNQNCILEDEARTSTLCEINEMDSVQSSVLESETSAHPLFSNHLILTEIFKHLPIRSLLSFSLVNKFWKSNARTVLRENKKCLVKIREENPCLDLRDFIDFLPEINEVPFNGLSIITSYRYDSVHDCVRLTNPSHWFTTLLNFLEIKYLKCSWDEGLLCPAKLVIKKILNERAPHLEGLYFKHLSFNINSVSKSIFNIDFDIKKIPRISWFPKLKTIEIPSNQNYTEDNGYCYPIVKELLCIAPNIKYLLGGIQPTFLEYIALCDKIACVKQYYFQPGIKEVYFSSDLHRRNMREENSVMERDLEASLRFAKEQPKLQKLIFTTKYMKYRILQDSESAFRLITEILKLFLEGCSDTLEELSISQLDLILVQRMSSSQDLDMIPGLTMKRVKQLTIEYNRNVDTFEGFSTLARINYPKLFPNLQVVKVCRTDAEDLDFYISEVFRRNTCEYQSLSVTRLKLGYEISDYPEIQDPFRACVIIHTEKGSMKDISKLYEPLFPRVSNFSIYNCQNLKLLCKYLWTTWLDLETVIIKGLDLDLDLDYSDVVRNLDTAFTGIPPEHWNLMKGKQGKQLVEEYEKYAVGPSIRNLTKLKRLVIKMNHDKVCRNSSLDLGPSTSAFSKRASRSCSRRNNNNFNLNSSKEPFLSVAAATCTFSQMPHLQVELIRQQCTPYKKKNKCRLSFDHLSTIVKLTNAVHLNTDVDDNSSACSFDDSESESDCGAHSAVKQASDLDLNEED